MRSKQHCKTIGIHLRSLDSIKTIKHPVKQAPQKTVEEKYSDIFKTISQNYFNRTSCGDTFGEFGKSKGNIENYGGKRMYRGRTYLFDDQSYNKEMNNLLGIADIFTENEKGHRTRMQKHQSKVSLSTGLASPIESKAEFLSLQPSLKKLSNLRNQKQHPIQIKRPSTGKMGKKRFMHECKHKQYNSIDLKFIKIDKESPPRQLLKLQKSVEELQNMATHQYGVSFRSYNEQETPQEDVSKIVKIKMQNIERHLKLIKKQAKEEDMELNQDCSIPGGLMCFLKGEKNFPKKGVNPVKKVTTNMYIRV